MQKLISKILESSRNWFVSGETYDRELHVVEVPSDEFLAGIAQLFARIKKYDLHPRDVETYIFQLKNYIGSLGRSECADWHIMLCDIWITAYIVFNKNNATVSLEIIWDGPKLLEHCDRDATICREILSGREFPGALTYGFTTSPPLSRQSGYDWSDFSVVFDAGAM